MPNINGIEFRAIDAPAYGLIWITAEGRNPTTGWEQYFTQIGVDHYEFKNTKPDGIQATVIVPFYTVHPGIRTDGDKVTITYDGSTIDVVVEAPTIEEQIRFSNLATSSPLSSFNERGGFIRNKEGSVDSTCIVNKLGSFDIPFGCATWDYPTRAKRVSFYVRICGPSEQNARRALEDCLKEAAVIAALTAVLTPIGWAGAWTAFRSVLTGCLTRKLSSAFTIDLWHEDNCV